MTSQSPDERPDAFEARLASRIQRHADRGVRPIDAGAIAHQAAASAGVGRFAGSRLGAAFGRLGWILVGAGLTAALFTGGAFVAGSGLLGRTPSTPAPSLLAVAPTASPVVPTTAPATPEPTVAPIEACDVASLAARVTAWDGAAGSRIATVSITNDGSVSCRLATREQPQLVDGSDRVLIDGTKPSGSTTILLAAGASASTMVDAANYCGADPSAPVTVAFRFADGKRLTASPLSASDTSGLPPCMGSTVAGSITMHPWAP